MSNPLSRRPGNWTYPLAIGVVIGALIAGLTYRISPELHAGSAATASSFGGTTQDGGAPLPGASGSPAASTGPALPGPGNGGVPTTGPGLPGPSASGGPSGPGGSNGGPLTATDVGVSASTIKVGVALLDLGGASSAGAAVPGFDPKMQQHEWEVFFKDLNDKGGILGRKVQAYFLKVDPINPQTQQAACVQFTQTDHVFLVFDTASAMGADSDLCVAAQNRTIVLGGSISPAEYYQAARGLLITNVATGTRVGRAWARTMEKIGKLKDRKLGLLVDQGTINDIVKAGLIPELKRLGYSFAYTAVVSNDASQGPSQVPAQVLQMQRAGVNTVFMASAFFNMTAFVNQAEKQNWKPQYSVSDLDGADVATLLNGMPASFDGAVALTYFFPGISAKFPESATGKKCRERWKQLTGQSLKPGDADYGPMTGNCGSVNFLSTVGTKAGTGLTRASFSAAVQGLGRSYDYGGLGGSFGPGKTDYNDIVRTMVWGPKQSDTDSAYCTSNGSRCFNAGIDPYDPGV